MANMSYVRFENTLSDLEDCYEDMQFGTEFSELSLTEQQARNELVDLCKKIAEQFDEEEIEEDYPEITKIFKKIVSKKTDKDLMEYERLKRKFGKNN